MLVTLFTPPPPNAGSWAARQRCGGQPRNVSTGTTQPRPQNLRMRALFRRALRAYKAQSRGGKSSNRMLSNVGLQPRMSASGSTAGSGLVSIRREADITVSQRQPSSHVVLTNFFRKFYIVSVVLVVQSMEGE